jgi:hypothetical protein
MQEMRCHGWIQLLVLTMQGIVTGEERYPLTHTEAMTTYGNIVRRHVDDTPMCFPNVCNL